MDAILSRLVGGRGDHPATLCRTANDERLAAPLGVVELLDRGKERVKVHEAYRGTLPRYGQSASLCRCRIHGAKYSAPTVGAMLSKQGGACRTAYSVTVKVVPASAVLVAEMVPPCASAMPFAMAKPSPNPPVSRSRALSER